MVKLVTVNHLSEGLSVPEEMGTPKEHHLLSTKFDNLIELAGRVCYDSLKQEKSRSSPDYHQHIIDVNHGSVQEHATLVFGFGNGQWIDRKEIGLCAINRPGVFVYQDSIVANIRAIREWNNFHNEIATIRQQQDLGNTLKHLAKGVAPMAMVDIDTTGLFLYDNIFLNSPIRPEEYWYSFYLNGVSRGLTHELVRHKFQTAISQRSTRYVDESESDWSWHPLILKYQSSIEDSENEGENLLDIQDRAATSYKNIVANLQGNLISDGVDKFTARKQARGAARGVLGNALNTELIFSASLPQWKKIIQMRMSHHADAEIRLMADEVFKILSVIHPEYFSDIKVEPSPDGIGEGIA